MQTAEMTAKMAAGQGFIAALDQSGGSTPKALAGYGIGEDAWGSEEEMFGLIHAMRSRIISSPAFTGDKVIGAILFERTMDGEVAGKPTPQALHERGVVPFIKIDKGLEAEANGVQLMKPMPDLDALLARSKALGVYGTKERSVINGRSGGDCGDRRPAVRGGPAGARARHDADPGARGEHKE
jgi:fructose-bisphosphate aldolase, class I